jgi:hypothetical protein
VELGTVHSKTPAIPDSTKPRIEKVSPYEVYLIDDHGRHTKQICGTQRNGMPEGYVCIQPAGFKTNHVGVGPCQSHNRAITNSNNTGLWLQLNEQHGLPKNLLQLYQNAEIIEERHMSTVDDDIKTLYVLQQYLLGKVTESETDGEDAFLSNDTIELLLKFTDKIVKTKEVRAKLKKEASLDVSTVKVLVSQIFKIILANVSEKKARAVLSDIMENVIAPFKTQGRIIGSDMSIDSIVEDADIEDTTKDE